ncbi:MAG: virulence RhuM family protein [Elusimicrobia bacterium]|nr:virulence RhuM family protein [Elusimicrobiota bacterium]
MPADESALTGEVILYQTEDGRTRIECRFENETIWLSQALIAELFQKDVRTINEHLQNIYEERELLPAATIRKFRIVRPEGARRVAREIDHYSLDAILAVGFRVRSHRGTQFRQWAAARLKEYLIKGFVMDDERLKNPPGPGVPDYFDELLARIRDIRSSERVFWRKVLDIYATSIDYDPGVAASQTFFATVQNKMHWAAHGQTAAEVIVRRADSGRPNMGLTSWSGGRPRKEDAVVAKNYLTAEELDALNRIVTAYLEFAELQARSRKPMHMGDWIAKLDDFLRLSEREILTHAGRISHETALAKAELEFEKFRAREAGRPSRVDKDFDEVVKKLPAPKRRSRRIIKP